MVHCVGQTGGLSNSEGTVVVRSDVVHDYGSTDTRIVVHGDVSGANDRGYDIVLNGDVSGTVVTVATGVSCGEGYGIAISRSNRR